MTSGYFIKDQNKCSGQRVHVDISDCSNCEYYLSSISSLIVCEDCDLLRLWAAEIYQYNDHDIAEQFLRLYASKAIHDI